MRNVFTRPDAICERCTSKRNSSCCIYRFLILEFRPQTTWNRQSNKRLPTRKQDTILSFIVLRVLGELDCLRHIWRNGYSVSLVLRLFSGFDVLFLVLWKRRSNNGSYSMTSNLKG